MRNNKARKHPRKAPRPSSSAKRAIELERATAAYAIRQLDRQADDQTVSKHERQAADARLMLDQRTDVGDSSRSLILMIINLFPACEPIMDGEKKIESRTSIATKQALSVLSQTGRISLSQDQINACCAVANHLLQQADILHKYDEERLAQVR